MNNMKKLISIIVFAFIASFVIGCGKSPVAPSNSVPAAGVYFIAAATGYDLPQAMISTGSKIRLGSESSVLAIENTQIVNDSVINLTLKYTTGPQGPFSVTARRLPLSVNEYNTPDSSHAFNGIYASTNAGAYIGTDTVVAAFSLDSVVFLTTDGAGWTRQKVPYSISENVLNTSIGITIGYNPITSSTPPYKTGCSQFYKGNESLQLVALDSLGR
jgi:hypothetical protein